jgi:hypothetical protein
MMWWMRKRFHKALGMGVFFQLIQRSYSTPEDPKWRQHCENWQHHTDKAISLVRQLVQIKREGVHIANSYPEQEVMIPCFRDRGSLVIVTQSHRAYEPRHVCSPLNMLQLQADGDVTICPAQQRGQSQVRIHQIWENRRNPTAVPNAA